jgi:acetyl esterase/lipase
LLKLPDGLLLAMSGGKPLQIDGRTLDVRTQFLAAQGAKAPSLSTLDPVEGRAATRQGLALLDGERDPHVDVRDMAVKGADGPLDARLYSPRNANGPLPGIVYFHFGGCVIGDLDTCDTFCTMLSEIADCVVLSVAYRLAPEHKFPAAVDDALAAFRFACENSTALGMNHRIAVGGDSAGGYLSAVVAQETLRNDEETPSVQLLIYPVTDMDWKGGSWDSCADVYPLTQEVMSWFIDTYLNNETERHTLRASPLRATDLEDVAPAIVITSGFDVLRDQGIAYGERLKEAGVKVTNRTYDRLAHGFTAMTGAIPAARRACEEIARDLHSALRG